MEAKHNTQQRQPDKKYNDDRKNYRDDGRTRNNSDVYSDNQQVFIGKLSQSISEEEIKEHFEYYGTVIEVRIKYNADGWRQKFGFVVFESPETARIVLDNKVIRLFC